MAQPWFDLDHKASALWKPSQVHSFLAYNYHNLFGLFFYCSYITYDELWWLVYQKKIYYTNIVNICILEIVGATTLIELVIYGFVYGSMFSCISLVNNQVQITVFAHAHYLLNILYFSLQEFSVLG